MMTSQHISHLADDLLALLPRAWQELLIQGYGSYAYAMPLEVMLASIMQNYEQACRQGEVFPPKSAIFHAFHLTKPSCVRIVIIGQDPYHGVFMQKGVETPQAMGLSFSVPYGAPLPPSVKNIYKELEQSLGLHMPRHGDLRAWAQRGALLCNAICSVEKHKPASHRWIGWEKLSDALIYALSVRYSRIIFLLFGAYAHKKASLIDTSKHCILRTPHPSPLARGFVGSGIFATAQEVLRAWGEAEFDWHLEG